MPAGSGAGDALKNSPRHQETFTIDVPGIGKKLDCFLVFPERKDKAPVVIVIHEIFGLSEWIKGVADHLAKQGFIAIAPNMITGSHGGDTSALIRSLSPEEVLAKLDAVRDYGIKLPAANGKTAAIGFCWGGSTTFQYAVDQPGLNAATVYYGTSPATEDLKKINAPVLGLYGEMDERVNATIPAAEEEMKKLGKTYEKHIFTNAGHGFARAQEGREGDNGKGATQGWTRMIEFLREHTDK